MIRRRLFSIDISCHFGSHGGGAVSCPISKLLDLQSKLVVDFWILKRGPSSNDICQMWDENEHSPSDSFRSRNSWEWRWWHDFARIQLRTVRRKCVLIRDVALILPKPTLIISFRRWNGNLQYVWSNVEWVTHKCHLPDVNFSGVKITEGHQKWRQS